MNVTDFNVQTSTIISTQPTKNGTHVWVRYDDDREACYEVAHSQFHLREGQQLTAILWGTHPVILRNDTTRMKLQLLTGEDILGTGPTVQPISAGTGLTWLAILFCCGPSFFFAPVLLLPIPETLKIITAFVLYGVFLLVVPYYWIVHPRIRRSKHQRRIKAADKLIHQMYQQL